jgi:SAM-dependent methyltransferase
MDLRESWEAHAAEWIEWARAPGHDSYWRFHRDQFLRLLPPPGRQTIDIGCGEGRLTRHLKELGHHVIGVDASSSLVAAARELDPKMDVRLADAAALPFDNAIADLAIAFMSLHDIDAMTAAVRETARVLESGGRLCLAIVHPINSAGRFETERADAGFVIKGDYLQPFRFADTIQRDGLSMTFHSRHRPLESYLLALEESGFLIEALREPSVPDLAITSESGRRWQTAAALPASARSPRMMSSPERHTRRRAGRVNENRLQDARNALLINDTPFCNAGAVWKSQRQ